MSEISASSERAIKVFRAVIVISLGVAVAYFVYSTSMNGNSKYPFKYGLDLAGGSHLVYVADVSKISEAEVPDAMEVLRDVIERRTNVFGVSEPLVQVERSSIVAGAKTERLVVELPGITDVETAVAEIGKTPLLEFKLVNAQARAAEQAVANLKDSASTSATISNVSVNGEEIGEAYLDTGLTGRYVKRAQLVFGNGQTGQLANEPIVQIEFNSEGAQIFEELTTQHVGEQIAIFLDGESISEPVVREPIIGGIATISGNFTPDEAKALVKNLNFGALPVPITLDSTQSIGSSLGDEALKAGTKAGVVGFVLLSIFIILWYRVPGVVAVVALFLYVLMMLALFKLIPVVLTAAGIAGFILSVGLAVDANVLIAERIKEELKDGKEVDEAIKEGFARAWLAIRDSNIAHVIAGVILFWFGTALIKGFALVFSLGVIISMFSAITISRTLLIALPLTAKTKLGRFLMSSGFSR